MAMDYHRAMIPSDYFAGLDYARKKVILEIGAILIMGTWAIGATLIASLHRDPAKRRRTPGA